MKIRRYGLFVVFVVLILFSASKVQAIGIAPARTTLTFESEATRSLTFYIINSEGRTASAEIYADGDLSRYITFSKNQLSLAPNEIKPVVATINFPSELPAGRYLAYIGAVESLGSTVETGMSGRIAAESQLFIDNLLAELTIRANLSASNASEPGQNINFSLNIENPTRLVISEISGEISIYNPKGVQIEKLTFNPLYNLTAGESTVLAASWNTNNASVGVYGAIADINYDNNSEKANTSFQIGQPKLEILKIWPEQRGNIAQFIIEVKNIWTEALPVWAELEAFDQGQSVGTAKSEQIEIKPDETANITIYFDTNGKDVRDLDVNITVFYDGVSIQKQIPSRLTLLEQPANETAPTGSFVNLFDFEIRLIYIVIALLCAAVATFAYLYKFRS